MIKLYTNNLEQLTSFGIFIVIGIIISIIFDIFRILRKTFKTIDIITYIEDTLFWLSSGLIILISIFLFNNGELRLYLFIGIIIGILFYMILFSKYFIKFNIFIINILRRFISKILQIISKPIIFIYNIIRKFLFRPISFIFINFRKIFRKLFSISKKTKIFDKKLENQEGI